MTYILRILALVMPLVAGALAQAETDWVRVPAEGATDSPYVDRNGVTHFPGCSGAWVLKEVDDEQILVPASTDFFFFYREGDPRKLVIAFDGGGACWDPLTCIGSALEGDPIYDAEINETAESLDRVEGLAASGNPENPVADYMQVFIPYCTADLHTGSRDKDYQLTHPDYGLVTWTIHHRGHDNFAVVIDWLVEYYSDLGTVPRTVFVTGASAGGYGAFFHYPTIDGLLPYWTKKRVFSDSANAIINQDFYDKALTPAGAWAIWDNMPATLANAFASGPDELPVALNQALGWSYPKTRFGQYTRAVDLVQVFYLNVAKNLNNPALWGDPIQLLITGIEWSIKARTGMVLSALTTFNYRYYLGAGFEHTVIADNSVYLEDSAGIRLIDWLDDMINRRFLFGSDWRNASCFPDCAP